MTGRIIKKSYDSKEACENSKYSNQNTRQGCLKVPQSVLTAYDPLS